MRRILLPLLVAACARPAPAPAPLPAPRPAAPVALETLQPGGETGGFVAEHRWLDDAGKPIGARLRHRATGFELDLLYIESAPQAFIWVNSFSTSDMGEAHTQEHLLLGKGNKGRWVANTESMSLADSSAFTEKWRTCYHMHTVVPSAFWQVLEADLDGLLHPDYTDEEIAREVRNFGVTAGADGKLRLEEKGTVYNEMVRSYEQEIFLAFRHAEQLVYGPDHPLALSEGGWPEAIRRMTPADIRRFHHDHYHLGNMGAVVSVPRSMPLPEVLARADELLVRQGKGATGRRYTEDDLPPPRPAPAGTVELVDVPSASATTPGSLYFVWPAARDLDPRDRALLALFLDAIAGDESTELYRRLIDSKTRVLDLGATGISGALGDNQLNPIFVILNDVPPSNLTPPRLAAIRAEITGAVARIAAAPPGSPELAAFNGRVRSRLVAMRRALVKTVGSPPRFGYRDVDAFWMKYLYRLGRAPAFERSLTMRDDLDAIDALLRAGGNPWTERLAAWKVTGVEPFTVAPRPSPALLEKDQQAREARIAEEQAKLVRATGAGDAAEALRRYKEDYDRKTAELEQRERAIELPPFTPAPPMTLDDLLQARTVQVGPVPLVSSTFASMAGAEVGLAFPLDTVAEEDLPYLAILPALLADVGIAGGGETIPYDEMAERQRKEILSLDVHVAASQRSGKVELVVAGAGNDTGETRRALGWMRRVLLASDWRADNLPRLRDVVARETTALRRRMLDAEESWADAPSGPIESLRRQGSPLYLHAVSFLTRAHDAHRLRWMLEDAGAQRDAVVAFLRRLEGAAGLPRPRLLALLEALQRPPAKPPADLGPYLAALRKLPPEGRTVAGKAAGDLAELLGSLPDGSLRADWVYLCREIAADLARPPDEALAALNRVRGLVVRAGGARGWSSSSPETAAAVMPELTALVAGLPQEAAARRSYASAPQVTARLSERAGRPVAPRTLGLLNADTASGLYMASVPAAGYDERGEEPLLRYLAGNLYAGGGSHSMFMKTWAAGLAYSNGIRPRPANGRLTYYAERCPRLPQTLRFVADELRRAQVDPRLADYAVAEAFTSRMADAYESRASAHAGDLADGITPEVVRGFRERLLALRARPDLARALFDRLEPVVGQLLPGYGKPGEQVPGAVYLAIGPESQLASLEEYLHEVEGKDEPLDRIFQRDFWFPAKP